MLSLLRPLLARPRTEWNHEDVLALARRLYCCAYVDGTGSAEDLEGETSNVLLKMRASHSDVNAVTLFLQVCGQSRALLKI